MVNILLLLLQCELMELEAPVISEDVHNLVAKLTLF